MAGTTIGEVNISLRMSLAQFRQDVRDGTESARNSTRQMASEMKGGTQEAKAAMALLGEEIGVSIPRHLRTFIAQLPGVATALSAAFNSIAVLALIELIVKVVEKVQDLDKRARGAATAWDSLHTEGEKALRAVDVRLLEIQKRLDELKGNHLAALRDTFKLIDAQTLDHLASEFDKIGKKTDEIFLKLRRNWVENLFVGGNEDMDRLRMQFDSIVELADKIQAAGGDMTIVWRNVVTLLSSVTAQLSDATNISGNYRKALEGVKGQLEIMSLYYAKITKEGAGNKLVASQQEYNRALKDTNTELENILKNMQYIRPANPVVNGRANRPEDVVPPGGFWPASKPDPVYSGTKEAWDLYKIQTDQNEAIKEAQKIITQTRTATEKYNNELRLYDELLKQGRIDQQTYNRAVDEAKEKMDHTHAAYRQLGEAIRENINQALLMSRSWGDAFKAILVQVMELIIQMTILKKLQKDMSDDSGDSGGGGGGGLFGSLLGGLFGGHEAAGGPLDPGKWYIAGEHGPEPIWGGGPGAFATGYGKGGSGVVVNYNIDARGSSITEAQFRQSLDRVHRQSVRDAVTASHDVSRRK